MAVPRGLLAIFLGCLAACTARPDRYPAREIKLIVQAAPGGISDTVSRVVGGLVEKRLGVPVVCENKPGAAGALAFSYAVHRPADGYTLAHAPVEISMVKTLGYAQVGPEDMDLLCLVSKTKPVLVVQSEAPWRNLEAFIQTARREPGRIIIANSGAGSIWHFNALLLERAANVQFTHVPFNGSSAALATLLGSHVDAVMAGVGEVTSHLESGRLRALAILDPEREVLLPAIPTAAESGYPAGAGAWSGFFSPRGLPVAIRAQLEHAFREAFDSPEFQKLCRERGMDPVFLAGAEFRQFALEQERFFASEIPRLLEVRP